MAKADLTAERLREVLHYDPDTGVFTWLVSSGKSSVGKVAGNIQKYRSITIGGSPYKAHRLAWLYTHGHWPQHQIDHINGLKDDNRIANLRDISTCGNLQNRYSISRKNSELPMGVTKSGNRFSANIRIGSFETAEQAQEAYMSAKRLFHFGNTR